MGIHSHFDEREEHRSKRAGKSIKWPSASLPRGPIKLSFLRQVPFPVTVSSVLLPGQELHACSCRLETCVCGRCSATFSMPLYKIEPTWY